MAPLPSARCLPLRHGFSSLDLLDGQGVWEPSGEFTAIATMSGVSEDGTRLLARVHIELTPDVQSYRAVITNEFFDLSGEGSGQIGCAPTGRPAR